MDFITHAAFFLLQLAVMMIVARVGGEIATRLFKQPAVLGELLVGVLIGPFALGHLLVIPSHGALFPLPSGAASIPVSQTLFVMAELSAVILLFVAGLETNFSLFFRYAGPASVVAAGGVILPFFFGAFAFVYFGIVRSWTDIPALFMGAIMTATSVGITARILTEIKKIDTPEGVTILAGAVVDDVFGIIVLSVILAISKARFDGTQMELAGVGLVTAKALGFWVIIMLLGLALLRPFDNMVAKFRGHGSKMVLALSACFVAAALAEFSGLAMIIGAYAMGLILSKSRFAAELKSSLEPIYHFLVPIFFVVTGMFVDISAVKGVLFIGGAITFLAILGKFFGCGLPALLFGFNLKGALRVGIGMIPRGEVALIVALVGLAGGIIDQKEYGIAILMTLVTTLVAPVLLGPAFRLKGAGKRSRLPGRLIEEVHKIDMLE